MNPWFLAGGRTGSEFKSRFLVQNMVDSGNHMQHHRHPCILKQERRPNSAVFGTPTAPPRDVLLSCGTSKHLSQRSASLMVLASMALYQAFLLDHAFRTCPAADNSPPRGMPPMRAVLRMGACLAAPPASLGEGQIAFLYSSGCQSVQVASSGIQSSSPTSTIQGQDIGLLNRNRRQPLIEVRTLRV